MGTLWLFNHSWVHYDYLNQIWTLHNMTFLAVCNTEVIWILLTFYLSSLNRFLTKIVYTHYTFLLVSTIQYSMFCTIIIISRLGILSNPWSRIWSRSATGYFGLGLLVNLSQRTKFNKSPIVIFSYLDNKRVNRLTNKH